MGPQPLDDAYRTAERAVHAGDRDRWLAALFVPEVSRRHIHALLAFAVEIDRVRDVVSDPLPGEVRLQWWREVIEGERAAEGRDHPIAAALLDTIERFRLPADAFGRMIEARIFDLYDDPMPTLNDLEGYAGDTASALIQLQAIVLAEGQDPGTAEIAGHAGVAYAITSVLRALPVHARRGQLYVPLEILERRSIRREDVLAGRVTPGLRGALGDVRFAARRHLAATRRLIDSVSLTVAPAFLPVALVEAYLDRMDRADYQPFKRPVEIVQWKKQLRLWRASRKAIARAEARAAAAKGKA